MNRVGKRAFAILFILLFVYVAIIGKLFQIQIKKHDYYSYKARIQQNIPKEVEGQRGSILDRNGTVLAYTKDEIKIGIDRKEFRGLSKQKQKELLSKLSETFGKSSEQYLKKINRNDKSRNVILEESVSLAKSLYLADYKNVALIRTVDNSRVYPFGSAAAHVIGYLNREGKAANGVEREYNNLLKGTKGKLVLQKNARDKIISIDEASSILPEKGNNVILTIDINFQKILEKSLSDGLKKFKGKAAVGIIQNPNNGEILAMASIPNYDPNQFNLFSDYQRKNRAVTDVYEPGSTIKSLSMVALIENNLVNGKEIINTENGHYKIHDREFNDTHKFQRLSTIEILHHSSNIGMVKLIDKIDDGRFYKNLRDFGFGNKTGIDLPGEVSGYLKKPNEFTGVSKYFLSIGYEFNSTPIQIVTAYSALVNGGSLYKPFVVKNVSGKDAYHPSFDGGKKLVRTVISKNSSETIRNWLVGVVEEGTAKSAKIASLTIGGKTGTSQKVVNGSYQKRNHNTSFVGFFPIDNPELVCYIWVESPHEEIYGGTVSAPIFKDVIQNLVIAYPELRPKVQPNEVESYKELLSKNSKNNLNNHFISANINSTEKKIVAENISRTTMPNLIGKSKREAISSLTPLGVSFDFKGNGIIKSQSVKPGSSIKSGMQITLECM